jgi:hypothetical protein
MVMAKTRYRGAAARIEVTVARAVDDLIPSPRTAIG